jgi:fluoroacetyl-CoA thioesterase
MDLLQHSIKEGASSITRKVTSQADTYPYTSGELDFLVSSPALIANIISKSSDFLDPLIPSEYITVGRSIEITHLYPTLVGEELTLTLTVVKVENNMIELEFEGSDKKGVVYAGKHIRAIVNRTQLLNKAFERANQRQI